MMIKLLLSQHVLLLNPCIAPLKQVALFNSLYVSCFFSIANYFLTLQLFFNRLYLLKWPQHFALQLELADFITVPLWHCVALVEWNYDKIAKNKICE